MNNKLLNEIHCLLIHLLFYSIALITFIVCVPFQVFSQQIAKGPYLIEPGSSQMIIRWESDAQIEYFVNYGFDSTLTEKKAAYLLAIKGDGYLYEVTLDELKQGVRYLYNVSNIYNKSTIASFTTFNEKQPDIYFIALGDSRSRPDIFIDIINNIQKDEPDLIISMGDLVAYGGDLSEWRKYYFDVAGNVINHIPLVSTLGDHEGDDDNGELFRHFLRTNQPTEKLWFSFDYGDAHFVSLDYRYPDSKEMIEWFVNDMSSTNARWKFVYFHRPAYNIGGHRSTWGQDVWPALISKHKVDIVFAGHSHIYERFYPMKLKQELDSWPVTYITTGGAGASLYEVTQNEFLAVAESVNHFVNVVISGDTLKLNAIRLDGSLMDELTIIKKGKVHDLDYVSITKPQERINLQTSFISSISISLNYVPFESYTVPHQIILKSTMNEDIPFSLELTNESTKSYKMKPLIGVLKAQQDTTVSLEIFSKVEFISISNWGEISPELKLKMVYTYDSKEITIFGGEAEYWPSAY